MGTLVRPDGPVKIEGTRVLSPGVLVARLSGAATEEVAVVRKGDKHFFVAPQGLGGVREIKDADSLTHGLHSAVYELGLKTIRDRKKKKKTKVNTKEATR